MRSPWTTRTHSDDETDTAELRVLDTRLRLRNLLHDLEQTLSRIEDKRRRGLPGE